MMDLGTVFKLSLYSLTALVGAILGAAEGEGTPSGSVRGEFVLPFLSLPVVIFGYFLTEGGQRGSSNLGERRGRGLSSTWANVLGIIALAATAREFTSENREGKLLAGTHLLLYATWIVLFQRKTVRLYWFLMALGILQLAVASVLTSKGWFGFCAVVYMFAAVWTLSIFSLWRAEQFFDEENRIRLAERDALLDDARRGTTSRRALQSEVRSAVQHEGGSRWLSIRFVSGVLLTTCSALLVSAAFFAFIPRVWVGPEVTLGQLEDTTSGSKPKAVLATSVRLGDFGKILESMDRVFEIQLIDTKTRRTVSIESYAEVLGLAEPLFRSEVLVHYDKGRWRNDETPHPPMKAFKSRDRTFLDVGIQQEIRMEPSHSDVLFCLGTPLCIRGRNGQFFGDINQSSGALSRGDFANDGSPLTYSAFTRLPTRQQMNFTQVVSSEARQFYRASHYLEINKRLPKGLHRVEDVTRMVISNEMAHRQKAEALDAPRELTLMEIANALESHLRDSGEYRYSLDLSIVDATIDPIEDFLINRKEGHCEYFATALALMLRAAKIPARVVTGYKGGLPHFNQDIYEIQQRYAHLWVEAWVGDDGWTTFDATPADARALSIASISSKQKSLWAEMQTTFSGLWSENVLNMSLARQEESIYKPIREIALSFAKLVREIFTSPKSAFQTFLGMLTNRKQWLSIGGGIFAIFFIVFIAAIVWLGILAARWFSRWLTSRRITRGPRRRRTVDFYERFVRMAEARGFKRAPQQTQREFAEQVASAYSPELLPHHLIDLPKTISQMFYRVRFGDEDLSPMETSEVEHLLTQLERALSNESR